MSAMILRRELREERKPRRPERTKPRGVSLVSNARGINLMTGIVKARDDCQFRGLNIVPGIGAV